MPFTLEKHMLYQSHHRETGRPLYLDTWMEVSMLTLWKINHSKRYLPTIQFLMH